VSETRRGNASELLHSAEILYFCYSPASRPSHNGLIGLAHTCLTINRVRGMGRKLHVALALPRGRGRHYAAKCHHKVELFSD